jgi:hypothetical protein
MTMLKSAGKAAYIVACAALLGTAACSQSEQAPSPISPSTSSQSLAETGATIAGLVQRSGGALAAIAAPSLPSFSMLERRLRV